MDKPELYRSAYLDSNTLIRFFNRDHGWEVLSQVVQDAEHGRFQLFSSPLLRVEAIGQSLAREGYDVGLEARVSAFLDSPHLLIVEFDDQKVARLARDIVLHQRLRTNDAIHAASAIVAKADAFFTFDEGIITAFADDSRVWVGHPFRQSRGEPGQGDLFTDL